MDSRRVEIKKLKKIRDGVILINDSITYESGLKNIYDLFIKYNVSAVIIPSLYESFLIHDRGLRVVTDGVIKLIVLLAREEHEKTR